MVQPGQTTEDGYAHRQVIALGDIPAGFSGQVQIRATVDLLGLGQARYERCRQTFPEELCALQREWAALDAFAYDDQTPRDPAGGPWSSAPLEWMWSDHAVDGDPPYDVGIEAPAGVIGAQPVTVSGYAYDESPVPAINLEVRDSAGSVEMLSCTDATPQDGRWQCPWTPAVTEHGVVYELRAQAVDAFGQASAWSPWTTVVVDTAPPTVTVAPGIDGHIFGAGTHNLHGTIADDLGVGRVQVCEDGAGCRTVPVQPAGETTTGTWAYRLPAPDVAQPDGHAHTVAVYGVDRAGNRSSAPVTVTYRLDVRAPRLTVTDVVTQTQPDWPGVIASGTITDGTGVAVYLRTTSPDGVRSRHKARLSDEAWSYAPAWSAPGEYRVWVQAVDAAGNITSTGAFEVQVVAPAQDVYLPLITLSRPGDTE